MKITSSNFKDYYKHKGKCTYFFQSSISCTKGLVHTNFSSGTDPSYTFHECPTSTAGSDRKSRSDRSIFSSHIHQNSFGRFWRQYHSHNIGEPTEQVELKKMKQYFSHNALISVCIVKPKGVLVLKKFQILCKKSPSKSGHPTLMYKRYCLYPQGYTVQRHLCSIEGVSLPLEARKGFLA